MADLLHLEVLTPAGSILSQDVREVVVPTAAGDLGILPHHAPLTSVAKLGVLSIKSQEGGQTSQNIVISSGILQVGENKVRVLVDEAVSVPSGDEASLKREVEAVRARLHATQEEVDAANAKLDKEGAAMRAQAAQLGNRK